MFHMKHYQVSYECLLYDLLSLKNYTLSRILVKRHLNRFLATLSFIHISTVLSTVIHRIMLFLANLIRLKVQVIKDIWLAFSLLKRSHQTCRSVRAGIIEIPFHPWQGCVLPLNYARNMFIIYFYYFISTARPAGFEPTTTDPKSVMISISPRAHIKILYNI
jgi:hypothetical protein